MAEARQDNACRPRGRPPVRSDEETTRIVLEVARHTFAVEGYAATSTEELARRAGISTKTLYRLFPGKAALFEAMCADRLERLLSAVDLQAGDDVDGAAIDAISDGRDTARTGLGGIVELVSHGRDRLKE